eukprot:g3820.t1
MDHHTEYYEGPDLGLWRRNGVPPDAAVVEMVADKMGAQWGYDGKWPVAESWPRLARGFDEKRFPTPRSKALFFGVCCAAGFERCFHDGRVRYGWAEAQAVLGPRLTSRLQACAAARSTEGDNSSSSSSSSSSGGGGSRSRNSSRDSDSKLPPEHKPAEEKKEVVDHFRPLGPMHALRQHAVLTFDPTQWADLRASVADQLRISDPGSIGRLHEIEAGVAAAAASAAASTAATAVTAATRPKKNSMRTRGKNRNEAALQRLQQVYRQFVCEVVAPHVDDCWRQNAASGGSVHSGGGGDSGGLKRLIFQTMPALRVSPPSDTPIGQKHRDKDYGHQDGQINFWLPLSPSFGANTLWVVFDEDDHRPLEGDFGRAHRFFGNGLLHYTKANTEDATRCSLDFRVVPGPVYNDDWPASRSRKNGRQAFFLGGYYSEARKDPASGRWSVAESSDKL